MIEDTRPLFGVVGNPVAHSQSPFIHQAFGEQTGRLLQYDRILAPLDGFQTCVDAFFSDGGCGLNVTVPFKEQAWRMAAGKLSPRATMAGAVNTLWLQDGALHGCNTDGAGLVADLERLGHAPSGKRVLLLGAGGASRGAIPALAQTGCSAIHIANRTAQRAVRLRDEMAAQLCAYPVMLTAGGLDDIPHAWDIVINATSSSLDASAAPLSIVIDYAPGALAYDMVYAPQDTPFMVQARNHGASRAADGLGMLVGQAAASFAIWHGVTPAIDPVLAALRARLHG